MYADLSFEAVQWGGVIVSRPGVCNLGVRQQMYAGFPSRHAADAGIVSGTSDKVTNTSTRNGLIVIFLE